MRKLTRLACILFGVALVCAGCKTSRVIPSTMPHAPADPSTIALYREEPFKYEVLGVVEVSQNLQWEDGTEITPLVDELKVKAAALGANGLLFIVDGDPRTIVRITGRYDNEFYQIPFRLKPSKAAMAKAIYVPPSKSKENVEPATQRTRLLGPA